MPEIGTLMNTESRPLNEIHSLSLASPSNPTSRSRKHKRNRGVVQRIDIEKCFPTNQYMDFQNLSENVENFSDISITAHPSEKREQDLKESSNGTQTEERISFDTPYVISSGFIPVGSTRALSSREVHVSKITPREHIPSILKSSASKSCTKQKEKDGTSAVVFSIPIVSQVNVRPRFNSEEKSQLFYTDEDIRLFRGLWEIRNVPFSSVKDSKDSKK
mmetsp:Transcript_5890/g.7428  ORF Transcript_5890/g.7428 Transcript_5890/m.7428 type:complete len:218 (+) Transcript_5890:72-725(+)|eukprot:CAMPEP_0172504348 /NCGR_PEP_ID=MMETSP1066-20121228/177823_1 /TAXON_ID=671091 /ORGANISM="Coscinodiscus wailesii, Strain CCMP2513" /LENGTH=217 /DNA_ID=CAMNT_0013280503 /DNA_START=72 /DNA_END=725 /DNA_ORIENTATION=+